MTLTDKILSPKITLFDSQLSFASIKRLDPLLLGTDRSLVFFVGAGASLPGNTGMPSTPNLLHHILLDAAIHSGTNDLSRKDFALILEEISRNIGFEVTMNDFWQICRKALGIFYDSFADFEKTCSPNQVHTFMAYWLSTGGTVVTTNYDRMIERAGINIGYPIESRYRESDPNDFLNWSAEYDNGGYLFKLHGSLDDVESCLGALEHIGTKIVGHRAELLSEIVRSRPLCFVGWRGVDPDIPLLLHDVLADRITNSPVFWIHYEGYPTGSISLEESIKNTPPLIRVFAKEKPILIDAERLFGELLGLVGFQFVPNPSKKNLVLDFSDAISHCSPSGAGRMVGIVLRRAGRYKIARIVLEEALSMSGTPEEQSAALQELSLLQQQQSGKITNLARALMEDARKVLGKNPDPWLQLNSYSGMLSMIIVSLNSRPWLLYKIPGLFRKYKQHIEAFRIETADRESTALHESLFNLNKGRLRYKLVGWLGLIMPCLAQWILEPFDIAKAKIIKAKDIHLHSRIDVLAHRALAFAKLRHCSEAMKEILEIDRLVDIFNDKFLTIHWENQKKEIISQCNKFSS